MLRRARPRYGRLGDPRWRRRDLGGTADTNVGDVFSLGGQLYVVGWATDTEAPGDIWAYLAWLNGVGAVVQTYDVNPTANGDGFVSVATDADRLYVGGVSVQDGPEGYVFAGGGAMEQG
jgi:hypothetical protein